MATLDRTTSTTSRRRSVWADFKSQVEAFAMRIGMDDIVRPAWRNVRALFSRRHRKLVQDEAQIAAFIEQVCRADFNCIDIGCNKGHILRYMLRAAPQGRHFAFEPVPELVHYLRQRFSAEPVTVYQMALSDHSGESAFYCVEGAHGRSALTKQPYPDKKERVHKVSVALGTLDETLPPGTKVSLIKIDCEGHDLFVIRGAAQTIAQNRPVILFERARKLEKAFGVTGEMIYDELASHSMYVARLSSWLEHRVPLTRAEFVEGKGGNIVAWPAETTPERRPAVR